VTAQSPYGTPSPLSQFERSQLQHAHSKATTALILALVGLSLLIVGVGIIFAIVALPLGLNSRKTYELHPLYASEFGRGKSTAAVVVVVACIVLGLALLGGLLVMAGLLTVD